jgi:simple sugar transport system permease protein
VTVASLDFWSSVLAGTVLLSVPVLLAALGETLVERAGGLNLGIEGIMLVGALTATYGAFNAGPWAGLGLGVVTGLVMGGLLAAAVFRGGADLIVAGISMSLLGAGASTFMFEKWLPSGTSNVSVERVPGFAVPGMADLPVLGPALFHQNLLTYFSLLLVPVVAWILSSTTFGLRLRAVGDDPATAELRGLNVTGLRAGALVIGAGFAGLGGAAITVGDVGSFSPYITAGRGYIALAVVIIARRTASGALAGALLFAFCDSFALLAQTGGTSWPTELGTALPYAVTLIVLVVESRHRRMRSRRVF